MPPPGPQLVLVAELKTKPGQPDWAEEEQGGAHAQRAKVGVGDWQGQVRGHSLRTARWRRTCSLEHRAQSRGLRRGPFSRYSIQPGQVAARGAAHPL